ncbi:class II fructose-bisphosphate aldolase [Aliiroseovarius sp. 2305UL8-7]|uniref:class II fructose-bisphosphate aldolase n=1 Tax=Aliiroseovarius conchicola TaxID=3121637 RepID=UPI0035279010
MTLATLKDVLGPALAEGYAVAGVVTLGWEDMRAYVAAAEAENAPIILQAGPGCRAHTPLPILGTMFRTLAEQATVPVVAHLDHGYTLDECREAIDCGFSSVMFDGSRLSLEENITQTGIIAALARASGVSCEGEIGFVGYAEGESSTGTIPEDAAQFAAETGIDAMAVSVGNVHLQTEASAGLDTARIAAIQALCDVPLVIHGGSGVPATQRTQLARDTAICKYNIGTELRMAFGSGLRSVLSSNPDMFDRNEILKACEPKLVEAARKVINEISVAPRV